MAGENLVRPKGIKAKVENFWYHYKFHTIAALLAFCALAVFVVQCSTKPEYDYKIVVATRSMTLSTLQIEGIEKELKQYGEDLNGDGEVNLLLVDCTLDNNFSDHQSFLAKQQKLQVLLMSDVEATLFLTDTKCLEWIDGLNSQTQFIANTGLPHNDGRGFLVSDTHIIKNPAKSANYEPNLKWPKDLSICRRKIEGTVFEEKEGAEKNINAADAFIQRIIKANTK